VQSSGVIGITTSNGGFDCTTLVLAAGAWSESLEGLPRHIPVRPVRGQMVALECATKPFDLLLQSERCYLIPRAENRVLVGATVEHVGFDARTTATGIQSLLSAAIELVPDLSRAALGEVWTGFRPGTPDDLPILGADPEVEGLYYATGHFRNGILLAPITAQIIADAIEDQTVAFDLGEFRADRFEASHDQ
jgi:glycine/D-amino acid oxidase-like deaminating enzyme